MFDLPKASFQIGRRVCLGLVNICYEFIGQEGVVIDIMKCGNEFERRMAEANPHMNWVMLDDGRMTMQQDQSLEYV